MSPEEENKIIDEAYQALINSYLSSSHRKHVERIEKAYRFARRAHEGIRRRSGEPYILHPIAVATIVSQEIGLGSRSICAALLHDVVEHGHATVQQIEARFGKPTARIVSLLTRDPNLTYMEYIAKIVASGSREALAVKWADLIVNTDPKRLAKLPEADRNSLSKRYGNARKMVEKAWPFLKGIGERIDLKRKEA